MTRSKTWVPALVAAAALAACFGGGGDGTPTPATLTITGTAAKGAALAGAAVQVKCGAATGSATTGSDGAYSATLNGASRPCAVRATGTDGSVFHSVVAGSGAGGSHTANITPLTEMLVARVASAAPSAFFDGFGSASVVTDASLAQGLDYLKAALSGVTDLTGVNPVADALTVGNALDKKVEAVVAALTTAGVTLQTATAAMAANPGAPSVISSQLAPVAVECGWLKSGKYRFVDPNETDPALRTSTVDIDAVAKMAKMPVGLTVPFRSDGACQFSIDATEDVIKIMASQGGILVVYSELPPFSERLVSIGLPDQTLPLAEVAGKWNYALWGPTGPGSYVAAVGEMTFDAAGNVTLFTACLGVSPCATMPQPYPKIAVNAAQGGFDVSLGGLRAGRAFGFKTLAGKTAFVSMNDDGSLLVGMRQESLGALPAVGTVTNYRGFTLNGNGSISALSEQTSTVTATDAVARTVTRIRSSDNRVDTLAFDKPRDGLRYRAPNSCTANGAPFNCSETIHLPLQGMGITLALSVGTTPASAFFDVTVSKPN